MKRLFFTWLFMSLSPVIIFGLNLWTGLWFVFITIGAREEYKKLKTTSTSESANNTSSTLKTSAHSPAPDKSRASLRQVTITSYTKQQLRQIAFYYTDSEGSSSYREVAANSVDDYYIKAFCLSRHAIRTFRIDRIDGYITMRETGELLPVSDWVRLFR